MANITGRWASFCSPSRRRRAPSGSTRSAPPQARHLGALDACRAITDRSRATRLLRPRGRGPGRRVAQRRAVGRRPRRHAHRAALLVRLRLAQVAVLRRRQERRRGARHARFDDRHGAGRSAMAAIASASPPATQCGRRPNFADEPRARRATGEKIVISKGALGILFPAHRRPGRGQGPPDQVSYGLGRRAALRPRGWRRRRHRLPAARPTNSAVPRAGSRAPVTAHSTWSPSLSRRKVPSHIVNLGEPAASAHQHLIPRGRTNCGCGGG